MTFIYSLFGTPMGYVLWACYMLTHSIGWSIIIFTVIVKIASFPATLKQQKNMAASQLFTPRVQEIQKKYRNNQQKMQEELGKLQKEGYNPTGGCLPLIITFVLLFGMIDVVYKPMTHIEHISKEQITAIKEVALTEEKADYILKNADVPEISEALKEISDNPADLQLNDVIKALGTDGISEKLSKSAEKEFKSIEARYSALHGELLSIGVYREYPEMFAGSDKITKETLEKLEELKDNIFFMGIDLSKNPTLAFDPAILIPILSFIFTIAQTLISQYIQKKSMPDMKQPAMMKALLIFMPLFSLYLVFTFPAGAGFYWTVSAIVGILQSLIIYKFWSPEKLREQAQEKLGQQDVKYKTETEVVVIENGEEKSKKVRVSDMSSKEQKEYYRKKLEEARKADMEKYGEVAESPDNNGDKANGDTSD